MGEKFCVFAILNGDIFEFEGAIYQGYYLIYSDFLRGDLDVSENFLEYLFVL
jgi:hypothetical protein